VKTASNYLSRGPSFVPRFVAMTTGVGSGKF